ncbi:M48 family metallopeptidase [Vibrio sonorensis]|uniref:M48 family metallopeptidase n=1 Tax=Vibrio sonorensis TaxID=1004316 RepID=UPI0008D92DD6|nr:M48 family metallopeptidase [Vibrio sonorensis]
MSVEGVVYSAESSQKETASLVVSSSGHFLLSTKHDVNEYSLKQVEISEQLGNLPMRIRFPDGRVFATEQKRDLQLLLQRNKPVSWIAKLEGNAIAILSCLFLTIVLLFSSYKYGVPLVSDLIVERIPNQAQVYFGEQVLDSLDSQFEPSQLSLEQQTAIRKRIEKTLGELPNLPFNIVIEFRSLDNYANAFAMPGGKVVLLDGLVKLAKTPAQLDSVIYHEIGHVYHQHVMHSIVESSLIAMGVAVLTGEATGALDSLVGGGVFLLNSSRSRDAEREADEFAVDAMKRIYGTSEPMVKMFTLLNQQGDDHLPEWLSTHPDMLERIKAMQ